MTPINAERVSPLGLPSFGAKAHHDKELANQEKKEAFDDLRRLEAAFEWRGKRTCRVPGLRGYFAFSELACQDSVVDIVPITVEKDGEKRVYHQPVFRLSTNVSTNEGGCKRKDLWVIVMADGAIHEIHWEHTENKRKLIAVRSISLPDRKKQQWPIWRGIETDNRVSLIGKDWLKQGENSLDDGTKIIVGDLIRFQLNSDPQEILGINAGLRQTLALASRLVTGEDIKYY